MELNAPSSYVLQIGKKDIIGEENFCEFVGTQSTTSTKLMQPGHQAVSVRFTEVVNGSCRTMPYTPFSYLHLHF